MVNEVARVRSAAEQTVQCRNIGRNRLAYRGTDRQLTDGLADGFGQACRCFAGRCGEANAQRFSILHGGGLQQPQQAHDRGGLAGAGAAGDDTEIASCRQRTGDFLPVAAALTVNFEGVREQGIEPTGKFFRCYRVHAQAGTQRLGNAALVVPVTTQVQALPGQHQRPLRESLRLVPILHHRAQGQRPAPLRDIQAQQPLRRQLAALLAFRWQRQHKVRGVQRGDQIQAGMPAPQLMTWHRGGQQHTGLGLGVLLKNEGGE
ncbi:hypothetical protein D3C86_1396040 [compost metagenome]